MATASGAAVLLEKPCLQDAPKPRRKICRGVEEMIGSTPMVEVTSILKAEGAVARVVAKMECLQAGGSVKDRIVLPMLLDAEDKGLITPGKTVLIEPSSGNTGVALAMVARRRGYRCIIVMPEYYSLERRILLRALGAEIITTEGAMGLREVFRVLDELLKNTPNSHMLSQFQNPENPNAHFRTTGPEIWEATSGEVDILVAGIGTGGTVTGTGRYLKSKNANVQVVGVEPAESAILSGGQPGKHSIQGMGAGFIPDVLDVKILDRVIAVHSDEAMEMSRRLQKEDGLLVGISSGAAFAAALKMAKEPANAGKLIVVVFPSGAERYLSTALFDSLRKECETMTPYQ